MFPLKYFLLILLGERETAVSSSSLGISVEKRLTEAYDEKQLIVNTAYDTIGDTGDCTSLFMGTESLSLFGS